MMDWRPNGVDIDILKSFCIISFILSGIASILKKDIGLFVFVMSFTIGLYFVLYFTIKVTN